MKKHLPTTRNKIGIGQEDYISFLGCSLSALAMYETGQRTLPTQALIKLGAIELALNSTSMESTIAETKLQLQQASQQVLLKRKKECVFRIKNMQRKLDNMKLQYEQCLNLLHVAKHLPEQLSLLLPNNANHDRDLQWLDIHQRAAIKKLVGCSKAKQQLLQLKMAAMHHEMLGIQELLDTIQA